MHRGWNVFGVFEQSRRTRHERGTTMKREDWRQSFLWEPENGMHINPRGLGMSRISLHLSSHSQTDPVSPNRHSLQHHHHSLQYTQLQLRLQDEEILAHRPLSHRCSRRSILPQLSPPRCPSSRRGSLRRPEPQGLRHRLYPTRLDMLPQPRRRMSSYSLLRSWNEPAVRMLS